MAKRFHGAMHFDAAPDEVLAAQCDGAYVTWKHEHMAAFDVSVAVHATDSEVTIDSERKLPAEIPAVAKRFVGSSVTVREVHTWSRVPIDGAWHGTVIATFGGAPMHVDGTLTLSASADGATLDVVIHCTSSVPLVGGLVEQVVGDQFMRALRKEQKIAPDWFTAAPGAGSPADGR